MIHLLFLGDVVGHSGCEYLKRHLPELRRQYEVDVCVVNGENSADGNGILPRSAQMLFAAGADVITGGNHTLRRREICDVLEQREGVLRPLNLHSSAPGAGFYILDKLRYQVCVISLLGRAYMEPADNPFDAMDELLPQIGTPVILVDFHGEATAEKIAMGRYLDGRVSAVVGTHTHVQTADEQIFPGGTGYITDAGMCGSRNSILGVKIPLALRRLRTGLPVRFEHETEDYMLSGVLLSIDEISGKTLSIQRIQH